MNLRQLFGLSLVNRRDQVALEWAGATHTFGDLDARSNRMAHALVSRGLASGDRLCVYLPNGIGMIDLYLASIKLGVIFVPINILYREREISHILADAEPKLYVTEAELGEITASDLIGKARALPGIGPILVLAANPDVATAVRVMQAGAADVIVKPFDLKFLIDRLRRAQARPDPPDARK